MIYKPADFSIFRDTGYGVGFHWTTETVSLDGTRIPYEEAVMKFNVETFVEQVVAMGAGHVLFTTTHSKHYLPGPNSEVDKIMPGRTCERDLIMDIADGLEKEGIKLCLYYNSGLSYDDPEWKQAMGSNDKNSSVFFDNWCNVITNMGVHYGEKIIAFWFDQGAELNSFSNTPWEKLTFAAKSGNPNRLITYNSGIELHHLDTKYQDYWAGEICRLNYVPRGKLTPKNLPWYAFLAWHAHSFSWPGGGEWVMDEKNYLLDWTSPPTESVINFFRAYQQVGGTVTFNLFCYQDGSVFPSDFEIMKKVKHILYG